MFSEASVSHFVHRGRLVCIQGVGVSIKGEGVGLHPKGVRSYAEIRNGDLKLTLCNVNMFCIV